MDNELLPTCCQEILDWHKTGFLIDGEVRKLAASLTEIPENYRLAVAEKRIADAAMLYVINS